MLIFIILNVDLSGGIFNEACLVFKALVSVFVSLMADPLKFFIETLTVLLRI